MAHTSAGPQHAVVGEQPVSVGEPAVRQRKLRVLDDRLLEKVDGLVQAFLGALIEVVAALQVPVARGEVVGLTPGAGRAVGIHFGRHLVGDHLRDGFLAGQRIGKLHVGRLGPEVEAARAIDEMNRDPHAIARRTHAAGDDQGRIRRVALDLVVGGVLDARGEDAQRLDRGQRVDDLVAQAAAEIFEAGAGTVVGQRHHRHRVAARQRRGQRSLL